MNKFYVNDYGSEEVIYQKNCNIWALRNLGFNKCHSNWRLWGEIGENGMSYDTLANLMKLDHAFQGATFVLKRNYFDDGLPEYVKVPIKGKTYADLWAAADVAIGLADPDHTEILAFDWSDREGELIIRVD